MIFRQAGDHGGISTLRIEDEREQFYAFALDGRDYYLTQYVEYGEKGIYKKYRLVIIDGKIFLRHVIFAKGWMIHAASKIKGSETLQQKVSKRFEKEIKPKIQSIITEIHDRLGLDYFGIDCDIDEAMNMLVFEINANMNIFVELENSVFKKHMERATKALLKMLIK